MPNLTLPADTQGWSVLVKRDQDDRLRLVYVPSAQDEYHAMHLAGQEVEPTKDRTTPGEWQIMIALPGKHEWAKTIQAPAELSGRYPSACFVEDFPQIDGTAEW
jgi:hypothetical protein